MVDHLAAAADALGGGLGAAHQALLQRDGPTGLLNILFFSKSLVYSFLISFHFS